MILLIDNYDSFTYNVCQLLGEVETDITVIRNDELSIKEIEAMRPDGIVLSPGPGKPSQAGICEEVIKTLGERVPILGICLGHQAICEVYGARITYAGQLMHGKQSEIFLKEESKLFWGMGQKMTAARYHSLAARADTIPECLRVIAVTASGEVMAAEHKIYPVYGVQFHPESVLTPEGIKIIRNFHFISANKQERQGSPK